MTRNEGEPNSKTAKQYFFDLFRGRIKRAEANPEPSFRPLTEENKTRLDVLMEEMNYLREDLSRELEHQIGIKRIERGNVPDYTRLTSDGTHGPSNAALYEIAIDLELLHPAFEERINLYEVRSSGVLYLNISGSGFDLKSLLTSALSLGEARGLELIVSRPSPDGKSKTILDGVEEQWTLVKNADFLGNQTGSNRGFFTLRFQAPKQI